MNAATLSPGDRVRLVHTCPIESEGVAPRPGQPGVLVCAPSPADGRRCWGVRFDGLSLVWHIPQAFLEPVPELRPASGVGQARVGSTPTRDAAA